MRRLVSALLLLGATAAPELPADLQAIKFTATGALTPQDALVHLFSEKGFKGYALVDSAGRIAWHYRTKDDPFAADRRKNGNFVLMDKGHGLVEVDRAGHIVHELKQRDAENEMHHTIVVTPQDTVLYLTFDTQDFGGKRLKGEATWEWNPDTRDRDRASGSADLGATHRGGAREESHPDVRQPHRPAAAVFTRRGYVIDGTAAKQVWQWRAPNNNYASAVGSARRLSNGNTLIAFGMEKGRNGSSGPTEAFEVSPDGAVKWHLLVEGVMTTFRVEPVNSFEP